MANRTDIPDCGRIQKDQTSTLKNSSLSYETNVRRSSETGASLSDATVHPPAQEKALRDAIARNVGSRRDNNDEKLPTDPMEFQK